MVSYIKENYFILMSLFILNKKLMLCHTYNKIIFFTKQKFTFIFVNSNLFVLTDHRRKQKNT